MERLVRQGVASLTTKLIHLVQIAFPHHTGVRTRIVEEGVARFTHTIALDYLLLGVAPAGKRVELAFVVIIRFRDGKITHKHMY